jgi:hypothetical protein
MNGLHSISLWSILSKSTSEMRRMRTNRIAFALLSFSFTLMAADPFVGTWKLNLTKSTLAGASKDIVSQTMTISGTGSDTQVVIDSVLKSGETRHEEHIRTADGKEHPARGVGFKLVGATETVVRVDASTRQITGKRDGKVRGVISSTVSPDGKVMTNRRTGSTGEEILVFEKQ